jgi:hypothetical protein
MIRCATLALTAVAAPFLTVAGFAGSVVGIVVALAAWILLIRAIAVAPATWPGVGAPRMAALLGTVVSIVFLVIGFFANYGIAINRNLCGNGAGSWLAIVIAVIVYLVLGTAALYASRRPFLVWPGTVAVAWAVHLGLLFVLPGTSGFCET